MKIYDISQELFTCSVFPGDGAPERRQVMTIGENGICNLTELSMCAHNGTHIDAPYHFYKDGKTIDKICLESVIGKCFVVSANGEITDAAAKNIIKKAKGIDTEASKRILIKGDAVVSLEASKVFCKENVLLVGNESQTVGPIDAPADVYYELLKNEVVILEGIRLSDVTDGVYFLNSAPINLGGSDGAPCRAVLIEF